MAITEPSDRWWKRLGWFAAIWAASVLALGLVSFLIRSWLL